MTFVAMLVGLRAQHWASGRREDATGQEPADGRGSPSGLSSAAADAD